MHCGSCVRVGSAFARAGFMRTLASAATWNIVRCHGTAAGSDSLGSLTEKNGPQVQGILETFETSNCQAMTVTM